jgi:broad specificity phosphatase PhoE
MVTLEIRRHSVRHKPGDHLTQEGVTMARRVGDGMGPFHRVLTSTIIRAFETAFAMGFAPDGQVEWLSSYGDAVDRERPWPQPFSGYAAGYEDGWAVASFCREQAEHWRQVVAEVPDGGAALLVCHGGIIEMGTVGALLGDGVATDWSTWAGPVGYCEGVRLWYEGGWCVGGEVVRVTGATVNS